MNAGTHHAGTLIVGASQAGVQLAVSLREAGESGPITLVGAESHPPYQRPPLSKGFLAGHTDFTALRLRTPSYYAQQRIEVITGERVTQLHLPPGEAGGIGAAITDRGRTLTFDRLALTVGARPRRLDLPGADLDGVCYLRSIEDAVRLRAKLAEARRVVVVGGGFIGLETAAVARTHDREVVVVEAAERLLSRSVAPLVAEFYRQAHLRRGADIRLGAGVAAITGRAGRVERVELLDGSILPADVVLIGIGAVPRTELAAQLGLACDGGIIVDAYARTSEPSVVAAGDCTVSPDPRTGAGRVRLESVAHAVSQARVAAHTLAGRPTPYRDVPWFWSDQYDLKLHIAGSSDGHDEQVVRGDPSTEEFSVLYYRQGQLLGIHSVNRVADYMAVRRALASGATIPPDLAGNAARPLRDLLVTE